MFGNLGKTNPKPFDLAKALDAWIDQARKGGLNGLQIAAALANAAGLRHDAEVAAAPLNLSGSPSTKYFDGYGRPL